MKDEPASSPLLPDESLPEITQEPAMTDESSAMEPVETEAAKPIAVTTDEAMEAVGTDKAVDEIVAKEGDELLAAEDARKKAASEGRKPGFKEKIKNAFHAWWDNKKLRYGTLAGAAALLFILLLIPSSRYFILNNLSVRASASMAVMDDSTSLPLKNAQVSLGGQMALSDDNGNVTLHHIKLGRSQLAVSKRAFATKSRGYTVGWGSNPLTGVSLTPVGTQYNFTIVDFLANKPIAKAQAESGNAGDPMAGAALADSEASNQANAQSDDKGKILLTVDKPTDQLTVTLKAKGYRDETLTINADDKNNHIVKLVPGRKEVFVSKRSGKYDLYTMDIDGKNEKLLLAGTGNEQDGLVLMPHPTEEVAAFVSTRDNVRNADGFLLSSLILVDLKSGQTAKITQSERIQLVDWIGDKLVYVQVAAGASAANPRRERLITYDYQATKSVELAATNYFNDVLVAGDSVYYAPSAVYQNDSNTGFFKVAADGTNRMRLLNNEVWNVFRSSYEEVNLAVQQNWYTYHLGGTTVSKASGAPAVLKTRIYVDNPADKTSLWVDDRDGKGTLLLYNQNDKKDQTLRSQSGLQYPVRWLNATTIIYRIHTDQETADYALSTLGGNPIKLKDVTNTVGISSWYYY